MVTFIVLLFILVKRFSSLFNPFNRAWIKVSYFNCSRVHMTSLYVMRCLYINCFLNALHVYCYCKTCWTVSECFSFQGPVWTIGRSFGIFSASAALMLLWLFISLIFWISFSFYVFFNFFFYLRKFHLWKAYFVGLDERVKLSLS